MSKASKSSSITTTSSGGWKNGSGETMGDDDSDDDDDEVPKTAKPKYPGSNENVNVIAPDDEHTLKREPQTPLHKKSTGELPGVVKEAKAERGGSSGSEETFLTAEEEEELRLPGSFDMDHPRKKQGEDSEEDEGEEPGDASWAGLFRRMGLRS